MSLAGAVAALLLAHLVASAEFGNRIGTCFAFLGASWFFFSSPSFVCPTRSDESRLRTVYSSENRTLSVYLSDVSVWTNRSTDTIAVALLRVFPESLVLPIRSPQLLNIDRQQVSRSLFTEVFSFFLLSLGFYCNSNFITSLFTFYLVLMGFTSVPQTWLYCSFFFLFSTFPPTFPSTFAE